MYTDVYGQFKLGHLDPLFFSLSLMNIVDLMYTVLFSSSLCEWVWSNSRWVSINR